MPEPTRKAPLEKEIGRLSYRTAHAYTGASQQTSREDPLGNSMIWTYDGSGAYDSLERLEESLQAFLED